MHNCTSPSLSYYSLEETKPSMDFWVRYDQELGKSRYSDAYSDRFGPQSGFNWTRRINSEKYGIYEDIGSTGRGVMEGVLNGHPIASLETRIGYDPLSGIEKASCLVFVQVLRII